jgi:hypothetical protein
MLSAKYSRHHRVLAVLVTLFAFIILPGMSTSVEESCGKEVAPQENPERR